MFDAFYALFSNAPDNHNISAFFDYISVNFIENNDRYPTHLCAEPLSNESRTINSPESYRHHCSFEDQFYNPHSLIYNYMKVLKQH